MDVKKNSAIIWLSKTGFLVFIKGSNSAFNFQFTADSVQYFDIVNEGKLTTQIEEFLARSKISNLWIHFVVGVDAIQEKDFEINHDEDIEKFIDIIPYEQVLFKKTFSEKSIHVAAFNGDFFRIISNVLEKHNSIFLSVLPYYLLGINQFNIADAQSIFKKADSLKRESIIDFADHTENNYSVSQPTKKEKSSLPLLIPVFGGLIVILIIMIYSTSKTPVNPSPNAAIIPSKAIVAPTLNIPESTIDIKKMKIVINYSPEITDKVTSVKENLINLSYLNVTIIEKSGLSGEVNTITFKSNLPISIKDEMFSFFEEKFGTLQSKEDSRMESAIEISLVK